MRIALVDAARGFALIAMTLFHFGWDLEMFALAAPGFASQPAMIWFARSIATSFLFLVGVSLVLAHGRDRTGSFNRRGFLIRLAQVSGAALLITIATRFATPDAYIFFGILHHIAVASILALAFVRLPWWATLGAAAFFATGQMFLRSALFDAPIWWWTGLNAFTPRSTDYVPLFPFFAAVLAGTGITRLMVDRKMLDWFAGWQLQGRLGRSLRFIGRHSLVYYLLHQPVMIAILYVFVSVTR